MSKKDTAADIFIKGFNCSQAVFSSFAGDFGLDNDIALKISCGLGGGFGRTSGCCGAVTGAILTIGLKYGKYKAEDNESKEATYKKVKEFINEFKKKYKSINCTDLLGCDLSTEDGYKEALDKKLFKDLCPKLVADAVNILEEIL